MKRCIATIHAAEPGATINDPVTATASTPVTWTAPELACQQVALLADIVKAAGKTLNVKTFGKGGAVPHARDHPRRWWDLQLLGGPQRRQRTGVRLPVEPVEEDPAAEDDGELTPQVETMATPAVPGAP